MTLNLKLGDRENIDPSTDGMKRTWLGYDPTLTDQELFDQNCGVWLLGARADAERYVTFSHNGEVKFVAEITGMYDVPQPPTGVLRKVIRGRVLAEGDPVREELLGTPINSFRNPVSYIADPPSSPRVCACGCGTTITGSSSFVPGHDQKALHERITKQWGSVVDFIRWFDSTYTPDADTAA